MHGGGWTKYGRLSTLAAWQAEAVEDHLVDALMDVKFRPDLLTAFVMRAGIPVAA